LHPGAREIAAGKSVPQQSDGAFVAVLRDKFGNWPAAHPKHAAFRLGVTQHRFGNDDAFEAGF
jgi:hypothetical protein